MGKNFMSLMVGLSIGTAIALLIFGVNSNVQILHNTGRVKSNIEVYWNAECSNITEFINWGVLSPGDEKSVTVYIRNNEDSYATMSLNTDNWNPSNAQRYMNLYWNCPSKIMSNGVVPVQLTLQVAESITAVAIFSFDILIIGEW